MNNNAIPFDWKKTIVVPSTRRGDRSVAENYRPVSLTSVEELRLLGCYAVWFFQEPHGITSQKTPFFIVAAVKTSNLT
jgi:hypothetical protein